MSESWVSVRGHGSSSRTMTQSILQKAHRNGLRQSTGELKWPAMSPDLNPIEHLWKTAVGRRLPSNLTHLEQLGKEEWSKIPVERCKKLIDGYRKRLIAVIFFQKVSYQIVQRVNHFVQSIFGVLCGKISDLAFFSNANKINTFVIATFFWEKWCII